MKRARFLLIAIILVGAMGAYAEAAYQNYRIPAGAGNPVPQSATTCFPTIWNGVVGNSCGTTQYWEMDITTAGVPGQTSEAATATVKGYNKVGDVACHTVSESNDLTVLTFGETASSTQWGNPPQVLALGAWPVPQYGNAYISCAVAPNAQLINFTYNWVF